MARSLQPSSVKVRGDLISVLLQLLDARLGLDSLESLSTDGFSCLLLFVVCSRLDLALRFKASNQFGVAPAEFGHKAVQNSALAVGLQAEKKKEGGGRGGQNTNVYRTRFCVASCGGYTVYKIKSKEVRREVVGKRKRLTEEQS